MGRTMTVMAAALLLAGCDGAKKSFDENFDKKFHESFVSSCIKSATERGVDGALASKLCTCASDKVKARYSVREKMTIKNEQLMPIVQECRAEAGT